MKIQSVKFCTILALLVLVFSACNSEKMINHYIDRRVENQKMVLKTFKSSDDYTIHYADNQLLNAPTILFIHGYTVNMMNFLNLSKKFKNQGVRLVLIDVPGFGRSVDEKSDYDFKSSSQARRISELINQLQLNDVHLVSTSMGGSIALTLNGLYPDKIKSNTTIAPFGMPIYTGEPTKIIDYYIKTGKIAFKVDENIKQNVGHLMHYASGIPSCIIPFFAKNLYRNGLMESHKVTINAAGDDFLYDNRQVLLFTQNNPDMLNRLKALGIDPNALNPETLTTDQLKIMFEKLNGKPMKTFNSIGQTFEPVDKYLSQIKNPVLVIWGSRDEIIHPKTMEAMKPLIQKGHYRIIKGGAHGSSMTKTKIIYKTMRSMFKTEHIAIGQ